MKYVKIPIVNINAKHNVSYGLYDYMNQEIERLRNENTNLKLRINKAIEYIETNIVDEYDYYGLLYENEEKEKLLDILKDDE